MAENGAVVEWTRAEADPVTAADRGRTPMPQAEEVRRAQELPRQLLCPATLPKADTVVMEMAAMAPERIRAATEHPTALLPIIRRDGAAGPDSGQLGSF